MMLGWHLRLIPSTLAVKVEFFMCCFKNCCGSPKPELIYTVYIFFGRGGRFIFTWTRGEDLAILCQWMVKSGKRLAC